MKLSPIFRGLHKNHLVAHAIVRSLKDINTGRMTEAIQIITQVLDEQYPEGRENTDANT